MAVTPKVTISDMKKNGVHKCMMSAVFATITKNDTQTVENPVAMIEASLVLYFPLFVHFICNQHSHSRTSHEGGHGVDGRAPRGPSDCPHQGAEELAGKVNKTIIHKTGQKDGADWNKSSHLDCQRFEEEGP